MAGASRSPGARRAAFLRGHTAEWLATGLLILKGYTILARRHAGHGGEIDIVARRGARSSSSR